MNRFEITSGVGYTYSTTGVPATLRLLVLGPPGSRTNVVSGRFCGRYSVQHIPFHMVMRQRTLQRLQLAHSQSSSSSLPLPVNFPYLQHLCCFFRVDPQPTPPPSSQGNAQPPTVAQQILLSRLFREGCEFGWCVSHFPRSVNDLRFLFTDPRIIPSCAIVVRVDASVAHARLVGYVDHLLATLGSQIHLSTDEADGPTTLEAVRRELVGSITTELRHYLTSIDALVATLSAWNVSVRYVEEPAPSVPPPLPRPETESAQSLQAEEEQETEVVVATPLVVSPFVVTEVFDPEQIHPDFLERIRDVTDQIDELGQSDSSLDYDYYEDDEEGEWDDEEEEEEGEGYDDLDWEVDGENEEDIWPQSPTPSSSLRRSSLRSSRSSSSFLSHRRRSRSPTSPTTLSTPVPGLPEDTEEGSSLRASWDSTTNSNGSSLRRVYSFSSSPSPSSSLRQHPTTSSSPSPSSLRSLTCHHQSLKRWSVSGTLFLLPVRYRCECYVGGGTYGRVIRAVDLVTNKRVAIKKISSVFTKCYTERDRELERRFRLAPDSDTRTQWLGSLRKKRENGLSFAKRIFREILILQHIRQRCDYLVPLLDLIPPPSFESFDDVYIVFPWAGIDLYRGLHIPPHRDDVDLPDATVARYVYQLLVALRCLHSAGLLHRDVKGGNCLWNRRRKKVMLTDFGLARGVDLINSDVMSTSSLCTRCYRCPELLKGNVEAHESIDVWSLGCLMFEMLTKPSKPSRRILFRGSTNQDQLRLIEEFLLVGETETTDDDDVVVEVTNPELIRKRRFEEALNPHPHRRHHPSSLPNPQAIDLLEKMLRYNRNERITVEDAMAHPFLARARADLEPKSCTLPPFLFRMNQFVRMLREERREVEFDIQAVKFLLFNVICEWNRRNWDLNSFPVVLNDPVEEIVETAF